MKDKSHASTIRVAVITCVLTASITTVINNAVDKAFEVIFTEPVEQPQLIPDMYSPKSLNQSYPPFVFTKSYAGCGTHSFTGLKGIFLRKKNPAWLYYLRVANLSESPVLQLDFEIKLPKPVSGMAVRLKTKSGEIFNGLESDQSKQVKEWLCSERNSDIFKFSCRYFGMGKEEGVLLRSQGLIPRCLQRDR